MDSVNKDWEFGLGEYLREGEPSRTKKAIAWQTAIGLQDVDGLRVSDYLIDMAKRNIEGEFSITAAQEQIRSYYERRESRHEIEKGTKEADLVSARIVRLLEERAFRFAPSEWRRIHGVLFEGLYDEAGAFRQYNITKKEWVLNGDTVLYAAWPSIDEIVEHDFSNEQEFSYRGLSPDKVVKHVSKFASDIWQIHPFCEGNTRSTAVFLIKYLNSLGFAVGNDPFVRNSWYFRNAPVRANYDNASNGVFSTTEYLEHFFENALFGANNELKNRFLHIDWAGDEIADEPKMSLAPQVAPQVEKLLEVMGDCEMSARQIAEALGLSDRKNVRRLYLDPALELGLIEMAIPDKPTSRLQKYRRVAKS